MSASPLNLASMSGAQPAAQPGTAQGIAQQAAQAAQAKGPLAGFEALLAAFFGDQGTTAQPGAAAGAAQGPFAVLAAQAGANGKGTDGKTAKTATDANKDAAATPGKAEPTAATASGAALDAAALALMAAAPTSAAAQPTQPAAGAGTAGQATPDALAGKTGGQVNASQLAAQALADGLKTAKAASTATQAGATEADAGTAAGPATANDSKAAAANAKPATVAAQLPATPTLTDQAPAVSAQALAPPPVATPTAVQTKAAQPTGGDAKGKGDALKTAHADGVSAGPALSAAAKTAEAVQAAAVGGSGKDAGAEEREPDTATALVDSKAAGPDPSQTPGSFTTALNAQGPNAAQAALAHAANLVRGSPQTVANLAAQIAKKLNGRSTQFDVQLDPAGLGKVDVRVQIDAAGKMSAALNFDNQQAASELKSRAAELQRAMEQAGFDISGGLSFDVSGQGGQAQGQDQDAPNFRGRAFQAVLEGGADAAVAAQPSSYRSASSAGVDIRI